MRPSLPSSFAKIVLCTLIAILAVSAAFAGVSGAIFTTTSIGTTVNGNIYAAKTDVYLNGGPQNNQPNGLVPDGPYYFMVTDPSGAVLLSHDTSDVTTNRGIECREVQVTGGRIVGAIGSCPHAQGAADPSNGQTPVQLFPYDDTPNNGGEYKAWLTPVANYSPDPANPHCSSASNITFGFCDSDSKTDNFKIRNPNAAYVTVCKFNDQDGDGVQDVTNGLLDPLIAGWPITATGVDNPGTTSTDHEGCVSFAVTSGFPAQVTLTEGTEAGWTQTAPPDGPCTLGGADPSDTCSVSGGVITLTLTSGDNAAAPNFGNTQCTSNCAGGTLLVTKTANGGYDNTFKWTIKKDVDKTEIDTSAGSATFNYTVTVTHDGGTISNVKVTGSIAVSNPNTFDIAGVNVTDALSDGTVCSVSGGSNVTVPHNDHIDLNYTCNLAAVPVGELDNTATASWTDIDGSPRSVTFPVTNIAFQANLVDDSVTVTDTLGGTLGTVTSTDPSPTSFTYSHTVTGTPGTCVSVDNTATFTTDTTSTTGSDSKTVKVCEGADLKVSKTATPAFTRTYNWSINKTVDQTKVETSATSVKFNYTVVVSETGFTDSGWQVTGTITVTNPNDWEAVTVNVGDAINNGGVCVVTGGTSQSVPASGSISPTYTCTYAAAPSPAAFTNTATATWDKTAASTPDGSASGTATGSFASVSPKLVNQTITPQDNFNGGGNVNLCVLDPTGPCTLTAVDIAPFTTHTYKYSRTVNNANGGSCVSYTNTAVIKETGQTSSQTVTVCNTATGALTMGYWKNSQGQGVITKSCAPAGGTSLHTFLTSYNPYKDDTATTCSGEASYVASVINKATCTSSTSTCNTMLRAQMLATALDVYFSTPVNKGGGGNQIGAKVALGGVVIDLSHICNMADSSNGSTCTGTYEDARPEFGIVGAPCLGTTVSEMLSYANASSATNGTPVATAPSGATWYNQLKGRQVFAKDGFDDTNNQIANIVPSGPGVCHPSF